MNFFIKFRQVTISQLFIVLKKPWLFFELFKNKKEDFWINHSAKAWFANNAKGKRIFEFGSGYSTNYLAGICKEIISVENNPEWFKKSSSQLKNKKVFLRKNKSNYVNEVSKHGLFDIVFVDGVHREECAKKAWNFIKKGGFLILDDVNSKEHAKDIYESFNCAKFKLGGLKSNTGGYWETGFLKK